VKKSLSKAAPHRAPVARPVQAACWLCPDVLLMANTQRLVDARPTALLIDGDGRATRCKPKQFLGLDTEFQELLALSVFVLPKRQGRTVYMELPASEPESVAPIEAVRITEDLKTILRKHLAPRSAEDRQRVLTVLVSITASHKGHGCPKLGESLSLAREALRQRLPEVLSTSDGNRRLCVDSLFALGERAFYIRGWTSVAPGSWIRLAAVSPEGARVELAKRAFWHCQLDTEKFCNLPLDEAAEAKHGFFCYFELPCPSTLRDGWIVEAVDADGKAMETPAPRVCVDLKVARQTLTAHLNHERLPQQEFRVRHVLPAITRLQDRHQRALKIASVRQYGPPPPAPEVSVVIPLYRRVDFLEHQLAQFVHDPELRATELIYVLDSPELADAMADSAAALSELYRVPFRLAVMQTNAGYAGANNLGASLAHGRRLLLLNSDILPDQPGWLGRLTRFHDSKPEAGAVGVKLLFEDDTLQHAGLYFRRCPRTGLWENQHYFKGLDRHLPASNLTRLVPAVSGACIMIDCGLYQQLGGLRGIYVQGDYEDSDLCLRLREAGREIWYLPEVELYHLEGRSYDNKDRARNLALNRWLHTRFWDQQIEALMRRLEFSDNERE
jgi:GT2 family glycosyltransferase